MARGDCLVLSPCVTHGDTEARSSLAYLSSARSSGAELAPRPGFLHCAGFWAGQVLEGSRTRGDPRGRQVEGPWGEWSGASICMKASGFRSLRRRRAARDLYWGSSASPLRSPAACKGSGPVASCHRWGFSGQPTALPLSLQWNNRALTVLLTPSCLTGAKPTAFPKCQCGCPTSRPLPEGWGWRV